MFVRLSNRIIKPSSFLRFFSEIKNEGNNNIVDAQIVNPSLNSSETVTEEKPPSIIEELKEEVFGSPQTTKFTADTSKILNIVAKSLYTDAAIFIRELISNSSDALEKARILQTSGKLVHSNDKEFSIRITLNKDKNTFIIQDNGVGMTSEELQKNLGTIAKSGTKEYLKALKESKETSTENLIGNFGVGFYSGFMVADKIEVYSRSANTDLVNSNDKENTGFMWNSTGDGTFDIFSAKNVNRGTKIVCYLKENESQYAIDSSVTKIVEKYSNFVGFPIYVNDKLVNTVQPIWMLSKSEVSPEMHKEFYRFISGAFDNYMYHLHFTTDLPLSIKSVFYIPERSMEKYGLGSQELGISLYSRKILIQRNSEHMAPKWLRFVKGVVDSEDIPLNISRENMQDSSLLSRLKNVITKRILRFFKEESNKDPETYTNKFFPEFGSYLKEGIASDNMFRNDIAPLLRYESSTAPPGVSISLDTYIDNTSDDVKSIFYFYISNRQMAEHSPYFEAFRSTETPVIFCYNPVDEFVMSRLQEYKGRKLVTIESDSPEVSAIAQKATELQKDKDKTNENSKEGDNKVSNKEEGTSQWNQWLKEANTSLPTILSEIEIKELSEWIQTVLADKIGSVKSSSRLTDSPAILVDHESASLRRMMKIMDSSNMPQLGKQALEFNPRHKFILKLFKIKKTHPERASYVCKQMYDNALIASGLLDDPRSIVDQLNSMLNHCVESPFLENYLLSTKKIDEIKKRNEEE